MMLEVDVESNRILLTEPLLAPPATNDGDMVGEGDQRRRISGVGHDSSHVMAHFVAGLIILCILAAVVVWASRPSLAQYEETGVGSDPNSGFDATGIFATLLDPGTTIGVP
jgi:hypothetical protein